jgi:hypothetical protein
VPHAAATPVTAFNRLLGQRLRALRTDRKVHPERIVAAGRALGLMTWNRPTWTAIERGTRQLFAVEVALLPQVLKGAGITRADGEPLEVMPDLFDPTLAEWTEALLQERRARAQQDLRRGLERYSREFTGWYRCIFGRDPEYPRDRGDETFTEPAAPSPDTLEIIAAEDAIQKAAPGLKVPPIALACAAWATWRRGLAEEREARLRAEGLPPRRAQAARGHLTRQLLRELKELHPVIADKRSRKGRGRS